MSSTSPPPHQLSIYHTWAFQNMTHVNQLWKFHENGRIRKRAEMAIDIRTLIHFQLVKFVLSGFVNQFCTWHHSSNDKPGRRRPSVPLSYSRDPDYLRAWLGKWELSAKYQICQVYRVWNVFGTKSQTRMLLQRDLREDIWVSSEQGLKLWKWDRSVLLRNLLGFKIKFPFSRLPIYVLAKPSNSKLDLWKVWPNIQYDSAERGIRQIMWVDLGDILELWSLKDHIIILSAPY